VAADFGITRKLGYFTTDSSAVNDSAVQYIARKCANIGVRFDPVQRHIRCFAHIVSEVGKAMLWGDYSVVAANDHLDNDLDPEARIRLLQDWRKAGPLGRLHNCIRFILKSPQRREQFEEKARTHSLEGVALDLLIGANTCWTADLAALTRAILLRDPLDEYLAAEMSRENEREEASLALDLLSPTDWGVLKSMVKLLDPFKKWMLLLQKKGAAARLTDVVPAYEELLSHVDTQMGRHSGPGWPAEILNSLKTASTVLSKYVCSALLFFSILYLGY